MATVLISPLILTTINGGFHGGVIIISAEAALDPLCAASHEWFCSPTDFDSSDTQEKLLSHITSPLKCEPFHNDEFPPPGAVPDAYVHSICADDNDPNCGDCLTRATQLMRDNCQGKDGAQYGTEQCCVRYEKKRFCRA
ncbi:unnamed protein product [Linum trigynum]